MLGPFLLKPCGMAKTWLHLSPATRISPPRPTCKGQSVVLLQEPSRSPRVIVSLLARMERFVLSTLWQSTCGKGVKSTFLQLSSEKRGSQARIWAAGGCFIARGSFGTPACASGEQPLCRVTGSPRLIKLDAVLAPE